MFDHRVGQFEVGETVGKAFANWVMETNVCPSVISQLDGEDLGCYAVFGAPEIAISNYRAH